MKSAKLYHNKKEILSQMLYATSTYEISKGLMFSSKKKISKGMCLVMPTKKDVRFGASVTMMFCFSAMEIIFINQKFKVVDKVVLPAWKISYIPKEACTFVIESTVGKFENINIGDIVEIKIN